MLFDMTIFIKKNKEKEKNEHKDKDKEIETLFEVEL